MAEVTDVRAEVIDTDLLDPESYEGWLAKQRGRVDAALAETGGEVCEIQTGAHGRKVGERYE